MPFNDFVVPNHICLLHTLYIAPAPCMTSFFREPSHNQTIDG